MTSNEKAYEMVNETQDSSEVEHIPEGIPIQNPYPNQYLQPQNQTPAFPHQYHPGMMPPQFLQQPMPQYVGTFPQNIGTAHQFLPIQLYQMNPAQILAKRQEYEREIEGSKHIVPLSWIMMGLTALLVVLLIYLTFADHLRLEDLSNCYRYWSFTYCYDAVVNAVVRVLLIFSFLAVIFLHYKTILAYRKKSARSMACIFLCFSFLFGLSVMTFNVIGIVIYGYLAYLTYKLKMALVEISKIDDYMANQGTRSTPARSQSDTQLQMTL